MKERRRYPRITASLSLKLSDSEYDVLTETRNISGNGVYCSIDRPIEPMTKLEIVILIPIKKNKKKAIKKISCKGIVIRKDCLRTNGKHSYRIGIYFSEISDKDRKALVSFINSNSLSTAKSTH